MNSIRWARSGQRALDPPEFLVDLLVCLAVVGHRRPDLAAIGREGIEIIKWAGILLGHAPSLAYEARTFLTTRSPVSTPT